MLSQDEILSIAALARIGLKDEEIGKYQKDLSSVLDYFKKMEELDTESVEPIGHITGMENIFRADTKEDTSEGERDDILKNAPEEKDGYIKVKSVL